ncbi:hypothetical protein, partial [Marinobacterium weihaiense]
HHKSQYLITNALVEESSKTELITFCSRSRPARGTFHLRFTLVGGAYPAYSTIRTADTVRVDYSY